MSIAWPSSSGGGSGGSVDLSPVLAAVNEKATQASLDAVAAAVAGLPTEVGGGGGALPGEVRKFRLGYVPDGWTISGSPLPIPSTGTIALGSLAANSTGTGEMDMVFVPGDGGSGSLWHYRNGNLRRIDPASNVADPEVYAVPNASSTAKPALLVYGSRLLLTGMSVSAGSTTLSRRVVQFDPATRAFTELHALPAGGGVHDAARGVALGDGRVLYSQGRADFADPFSYALYDPNGAATVTVTATLPETGGTTGTTLRLTPPLMELLPNGNVLTFMPAVAGTNHVSVELQVVGNSLFVVDEAVCPVVGATARYPLLKVPGGAFLPSGTNTGSYYTSQTGWTAVVPGFMAYGSYYAFGTSVVNHASYAEGWGWICLSRASSPSAGLLLNGGALPGAAVVDAVKD